MNKRRITAKLNNRLKKTQENRPQGWHSAAYHRHFEGYGEYTERDAAGKTHLRRVYKGEWYEADLSGRQRICLCVCLCLTWLASCGLFLLCAARPIGANRCWYTAIGAFASVMSLGWAGAGLFACLWAPKRMTVGDWRASSLRLKRGALAAALSLGHTAMLILLYLVLNQTQLGEHLLCAGGLLLSGLLCVLLNRLEANVTYLHIPNEKTTPPEAADIL